jgi:predicted permease
MTSTVTVVLPIFALVLAGFLCRRLGVLGPGATSELNRFVVYLALPAVLLEVMSHATWSQLYQPGFVATFGVSCACVYALTVVARRRAGRPLVDASIDGLNAAYANAGFIGLPLCLAAFGRESLPAATIAMILTVCVLFAVAIILIETGLQSEVRPAHVAIAVGRSLIRNPLLLAPLLGIVLSATGVAMPAALDRFLAMLGDAASPTALVALGLFLGETRSDARHETVASLTFVVLKLLLQPALAFALAYGVFRIPPMLANVAVVLAGLPTGTGPFMLAEFYGREASITSKTVLISTMASVFTVSAYLDWVAR